MYFSEKNRVKYTSIVYTRAMSAKDSSMALTMWAWDVPWDSPINEAVDFESL